MLPKKKQFQTQKSHTSQFFDLNSDKIIYICPGLKIFF